jgi:hypothetical protein
MVTTWRPKRDGQYPAARDPQASAGDRGVARSRAAASTRTRMRTASPRRAGAGRLQGVHVFQRHAGSCLARRAVQQPLR